MPVYGFDENKNKVEVPSVASFSDDNGITVLPNGLKLYREVFSNDVISAGAKKEIGISLGRVGDYFTGPSDVTCLVTPVVPGIGNYSPVVATISHGTTVDAGGDIYNITITLNNVGSSDVTAGCEVLLVGF